MMLSLMILPMSLIFSTNAVSDDNTCDAECVNCLVHTPCDYDTKEMKDIPENEQPAVRKCRVERAMKCIIIPQKDASMQCDFKNMAITLMENRSKTITKCMETLDKRDCRKYDDEDLRDLCRLGSRIVCKSIEQCLKERGFKGEYELIEECHNANKRS